jgi:Tol biopolymer transport system component
VLLACFVVCAGWAARQRAVGTDRTQPDGGSSGLAISRDGRFVAFTSDAANLVGSDTNGDNDIFVRDRASSKRTRVSVASAGQWADAESWGAAISGDSRYVAFASNAQNLIPGDTGEVEYPWHMEIFRRDLSAQTTDCVSMTPQTLRSAGKSGFPTIGADPSLVTFHSTVRVACVNGG